MNLSQLRDKAEAALAEDRKAQSLLAGVEAHLQATSREVDRTSEAFAAGLDLVGGIAVDLDRNPPRLYVRSHDGLGFRSGPLPLISHDLGDDDDTPTAYVDPSYDGSNGPSRLNDPDRPFVSCGDPVFGLEDEDESFGPVS